MLDLHLKESLTRAHLDLVRQGSLLSQEQLDKSYGLFRTRFGPEVLSKLQGEDLLRFMHARPSRDSLVYWLEFKKDDEFPGKFGSISGGSALKFGLYYKQENGTWVAGNPLKQVELSVDAASDIARKQRDQLVEATHLLDALPENAADSEYLSLQEKMDGLAPDVSQYAWGHKYLSLLYPTKLDDYHNPDFQRYYLIKLIQTPPTPQGLYVAAGQFVRAAAELGIPINHLTTVLNHRYKKPRRYWRVGTKLGQEDDIWPLMRDNSFIAIGWPKLGRLAEIKDNDDFRKAVFEGLCKQYEMRRNVASRKSGEIQNFVKGISDGDLVLAADGRRILGIGRVTGEYRSDERLNADAPNRRPVEWLSLRQWELPTGEGLQTTCVQIKDDVENLIETERQLLEPVRAADQKTPPPPPIPPDSTLPAALNLILYGPPGTGKTHRLRNFYMDKFTEKQAAPTQEERTNALAKDLSWWEVAALALLDSKDSKAPVAKVAAHPLVQARLKLSANKNLRAVLWASLQSHTKRDCPNVNYAARMDPLLFWKDDNSVWSIDPQAVDKEVPELRKLLDDFKNPVAAPTPIERFKFTTFHQSFSYEDFVEGIKPQTNDSQGEQGAISYDVMPGIFKEICLQAKDNPTKRYAIFIDEINRGNVASIFGELITLIEEDKRLGGPNQLTATLPYSREAFGVPSNLYIIGTMNTADRSVEALDTALRRRFTFEEMRPEADKITQPSNLDVDLHKLFQTINSRIEQLLDRDHCIGHYYLMGVSDLVDLRGAFANKIIPLLREYFYGNPAKVGMVLGERFVSARADRVDFAPGNWGTEDLDEKVVYEFKDVSDFSIQDFVSIYESPRTGI